MAAQATRASTEPLTILTPSHAESPQLPPPENAALETELRHLQVLARRSNNAGSATTSVSTKTARDAAWTLALLYLNGQVPGATHGEARHWLLRAQQLGEPMSAAGLAWCAMDGCGGPSDRTDAQRWITALRRVDPARAQYLQWLLGEQQTPLAVPEGTAQTARSHITEVRHDTLLLQAARGGNPAARIQVGLDLVAQNRLQDALLYFDAAAPKSPAATTNARVLRERLQPSPEPRRRDQTTGATLLANARRAHRGEGIPANYAEALRLYQLAAQAGSAEAQRMLELIASRLQPSGQIDPLWMRELAQVETSASTLRIDAQAQRRALQRDPTPLFDLLPTRWRVLPPMLR